MRDPKTQNNDCALDCVLASKFEVLVNGDFQERWEVAKTIVRSGPPVIPALIALLEAQEVDPELQWFAARILGEFDRPDVLATLSKLLQSEDEDLRGIAASALGNIGASAVETLAVQLARDDTRLLAAQSLAHMRCSAAIAPLVDLARDVDPSLRTTAIAALSRFPDPVVLPVLVGALEDLSASVRREAAIGLGLVATRLRNKEPGILHLESEREVADWQLGTPSNSYHLDTLVDLLGKRLWDFNLDVCQQAAIALSRAGTDAAASAIYQAIVAPATPILLQLESIRALGWIGTLPALKYLEKALAHFDTPARQCVDLWREIVTVLSRTESSDLRAKAVQILIDLLKCDRPAVQHASIRQAIALGLGQLGDLAALDSLMQLASDRDLSVRLHAATALKQLNEKCQRDCL